MAQTLSLHFQGLIPIPLRERLQSRESEIWLQEIQWTAAEQIFLQAPSGTGKTTLLHILYGLRNDYEGQVRWGSGVIRTMDPEQLASLRQKEISVIFQDLRLFPTLTTWENLEIKRMLTNTISQEEVRSWMDRLGIADRTEQAAATLSYGEQQRVAILRALLQPFSWLLMDEPFSHLDAHNTQLASKLIQEVVTRNQGAFLLLDLDDNRHFNYTQKRRL